MIFYIKVNTLFVTKFFQELDSQTFVEYWLEDTFDMSIQQQKLDTGNKNNRKCTWYQK